MSFTMFLVHVPDVDKLSVYASLTTHHTGPCRQASGTLCGGAAVLNTMRSRCIDCRKPGGNRHLVDTMTIDAIAGYSKKVEHRGLCGI